MNPYGEGWHLDRAKFDQFICDWWGEWTLNGVRELYEGITFQSAEKSNDGRWVVTVQKAGSKGGHCDWLVDASGRRACIARKHARTADGIPSLLPDNHHVVAFHTDANAPAAKQARRHDGFLELLHEQTTHLREIIEWHQYVIADRVAFPQYTAALGRDWNGFSTQRQNGLQLEIAH
ncbi:hypothetical protein BC936DRAFT_145798 [Jimgerdemannia flammicorona]|uniref:Uncharacterized protein n=1 Tax=Jimgerdemannia flammicorona TaxID=994334 RepID=A0A433D914_9FUNG|nr:hypothetical protein BC936DRAFT_145798 [Jimgerdemannia flammicorona]